MAEPAERTIKRTYKRVPNYTRGNPGPSHMDTILAREQRAREAMVAIEETKIIAEKLKECYEREGVNHYVKCEKIARAYFKRISTPDFKDTPVEMSDID